MKTKLLISCLTLALFVLSTPAWSDDRSFRMDPAVEPDGFQGIKWGEDLSKVPGMTKIGVSGASGVYTRQDEGLTVALVAKVRDAQYFEYDNKFYAVKIYLEPGEENWQALKKAIIEKYGAGYDAGSGNYLLIGDNAGLQLRCPPASDNSWSLSIFSRPLSKEAEDATRLLKQPPQK